jgi:hypothetical protein
MVTIENLYGLSWLSCKTYFMIDMNAVEYVRLVYLKSKPFEIRRSAPIRGIIASVFFDVFRDKYNAVLTHISSTMKQLMCIGKTTIMNIMRYRTHSVNPRLALYLTEC